MCVEIIKYDRLSDSVAEESRFLEFKCFVAIVNKSRGIDPLISEHSGDGCGIHATDVWQVESMHSGHMIAAGQSRSLPPRRR